MFNSVEYIRDICSKRNIPISQLEKDCGFANGYMNPKKLKKIPYDRAKKIAEYLGLSLEYLLTGTDETKKMPTQKGEQKRKLRSVARLESADITPELDKNIADYIDFLLKRRDSQE